MVMHKHTHTSLITLLLALCLSLSHSASAFDVPVGAALAAPISQPEPGEMDINPGPSPEITANPATRELINQVQYWLDRERPDMAQSAVNQLARVATDITDVYAEQALVDIANNKKEEARKLLDKIKVTRPDHPLIANIEWQLQGNQSNIRTSIRRADQLAAIGKVSEALQLFRTTFPQGIPDGPYALQYWRLVARTPGGRGTAIHALEKMLQESPGNPDDQLALACLRTGRYPWSQADLNILIGLSHDAQYSSRAKDCWRDAVMGIPPTAGSSFAALNQYVEQNPDDLGAKEHLANNRAYQAHQRILLADPVYQAKMRGLGYFNDGDYDKARELLLQSYKKYPKDVEIVGGIGKTYLKQGRDTEAAPWFRQALKLEPDERSKWNALIFTATFWGALQDARTLSQAGHYTQAEAKIHEALKLDPQQVDAQSALIRLKMDEEQFNQATKLAQQLPEPQQDQMVLDIHAAEARYLHRQADLSQAAGKPDQAFRFLVRANELNPLDPWITYDLAEAQVQHGHPEAGNRLFDKLVASQPHDPATLYADSLYLSKRDQTTQALRTLEQIDPAQRDDKIMALQRRLWVSWQIQQARAYAAHGQPAEARKILDQVHTSVGPQDYANQTEVAFVWLALGDKTQARSLLDQVRATTPQLPLDWHVRYAKFLEEAGPDSELQSELAYLDKASLTPEERVDVNQIHTQVTLKEVRQRLDKGDVAGARLLTTPLLAANPQSPEVLDVSSQIAQRDGKLDEAIQELQQSLNQDPDKTDYRYQRLAKMLDERTTWVSAGFDGTQRAGTAGQSELNATDIPIELRTPLAVGGELVLRSDQVEMSAGAINPHNTYATNTFGSMLLCQPNCSTAFLQQSAVGRSYTVGYDNQDLHAQFGTTPIGFAVTNWVGGIQDKGDWGPASWSLDIGRRPLTSTLLSYAGTRDPRTGMIWGGVLTSGATFGLSLDQGETNGFWSNFSAYQLTGDNVQSNTSERFIAGWTHRLINQENELLSTGLTTMLWHFNQDSGEFTFGQGGYYSPQKYVSLGIPFTYARRYERFSYMVHGSVFDAWAQTNASPYYPTDPQLQAQSGNPYYTTSSGSSFGYSAVAAWEYQATPSLFIGNRWEVERSPYYAPNSVLLYMRYAFDHSGAMPVLLQPEALQPTYPFY